MSGSISTIQQYFTNILDRPADQAGLATYVNEAAGGTTNAQIETQIATSPEAVRFVNPVVQLYEGILGRVPDASGQSFFVNLFRNGTASLTAIAASMAASPEGQARLGSTVSSASVTALYQSSLGRAPSASDVSFWTSSGLSLPQVAASIATSAESTAFSAGNVLNYLLAVGQGQPTGTTTGQAGQTVSVNSAQNAYLGTTGNDVFSAPTTISQLTGGVIPSITNSTSINGKGGSDTLQVGLTGGAVTPALSNGVTTVQVLNSNGGGLFGLSNSGAVTETDLVNSPVAVTFTNATGVTGASIQNSAGGSVNDQGTTSTSFTASTIASTGSAVTVSTAGAVGLSSLTVNASSGSTASATAPDAFAVTDVDAAAPKALTVNALPSGFETVGLLGSAAGSGTVTIGNVATTSTSTTTTVGELALATALTKASTVTATAFTGNLEAGSATKSLVAAETLAGSALPTTLLGLTAGNIGLTVSGDANLTSVTTGSGLAVVDLSSQADSNAGFTATLGAGGGVIFLGAQATTKATFVGGAGSNEIGILNGGITATGSGDKFTNFQTLEIGPNAAGLSGGINGGTGTYNLANVGATTVAVTGTTSGGNALNGAVTLGSAPDNLSLVETAAQGSILTTPGANGITAQFGKGSGTGSTHTFNVVLDANGGTADKAAAGGQTGTVNAGPITATQSPNVGGVFVPGASTETINIASNANAGGTATASSYINTVGTLVAADATTIKLTGAAGLTIDGINGSSSLTSVDASMATGAIATGTINAGVTETDRFTYAGSSGTDTITFAEINPPGAGATGVKFTNTFTGNGGNDTFNMGAGGAGDQGGDTFVYKAASDAILATPAGSNPTVTATQVANGTSGAETINGFVAASTANVGADSINLANLGLSNNAVFVSTSPAPANFLSISGEFAQAAGSGTYYQNGVVPATTPTQAGVALFQNGANEVDVLVNNQTSNNFVGGTGGDMFIRLVNQGGLSATAIATNNDIKFI